MKVPVITSSVAKITFIVAGITFKVAVITSLFQWPIYIFCSDQDHFSVAAISLSVAIITFVVVVITFKLLVGGLYFKRDQHNIVRLTLMTIMFLRLILKINILPVINIFPL